LRDDRTIAFTAPSSNSTSEEIATLERFLAAGDVAAKNYWAITFEHGIYGKRGL
jgi:hypothetical protein